MDEYGTEVRFDRVESTERDVLARFKSTKDLRDGSLIAWRSSFHAFLSEIRKASNLCGNVVLLWRESRFLRTERAAAEYCGEINGLGKHVYALRISIIRTYLHILTRYERTLAYSQR